MAHNSVVNAKLEVSFLFDSIGHVSDSHKQLMPMSFGFLAIKFILEQSY